MTCLDWLASGEALSFVIVKVQAPCLLASAITDIKSGDCPDWPVRSRQVDPVASTPGSPGYRSRPGADRRTADQEPLGPGARSQARLVAADGRALASGVACGVAPGQLVVAHRVVVAVDHLAALTVAKLDNGEGSVAGQAGRVTGRVATEAVHALVGAALLEEVHGAAGAVRLADLVVRVGVVLDEVAMCNDYTIKVPIENPGQGRSDDLLRAPPELILRSGRSAVPHSHDELPPCAENPICARSLVSDILNQVDEQERSGRPVEHGNFGDEASSMHQDLLQRPLRHVRCTVRVDGPT